MGSLSQSFAQGVMLFIDYGFPRHEYYHPSRSMGTLMCHYRHHAHSDPLVYIGLQDITAHVDFTALGYAAINNSLHVGGFTNQGAFLLFLIIQNISRH
jgi:SAM-dependent MidA family methyltransferase